LDATTDDALLINPQATHRRRALGNSSPLAAMGEGGGERWIAYPIILWVMALGGYLMGMHDEDRDCGCQH
jgi:hypothetical protein